MHAYSAATTPRAQHQERLGDVLDGEDLVGVVDLFLLEGQPGGPVRARAGGDEELRRGQDQRLAVRARVAAGHRIDLHPVGVEEPRAPDHDLDAVPIEVALDALVLLVDDDPLAVQEGGAASGRGRSSATSSSPRWVMPDKASALSRSVLLGKVPVRVQAPPSLGAVRSTSATRFPKYAACAAPFSPRARCR